MPNLRWFDDQVDGADSQESATLVTPYGPCIDLVGDNSAEFSSLFVGNYYHAPHEKGAIAGNYQGRLTAIHAAENYCHKWYISERNKPPTLLPHHSVKSIRWSMSHCPLSTGFEAGLRDNGSQ